MALTVVSEMMRLGYRILDDISVVGFGDFSAATQVSPQLTTVKVQGLQMGAGLVRILDDRLKDRIPADVPVRMGFVSHLVIRKSSGPASGSSVSRPVHDIVKSDP